MADQVSRRRFLSGLAAAGSLAGAGGLRRPAFALDATAGSRRAAQTEPEHGTLLDPKASGIEHVVWVMMENRSFDHLLGWLPGAHGRQAGLKYKDKQGVAHATYHLTDFQNCALADPDHSYAGGRLQFDGGKCDGWLRAATDDLFPIGYFTASDEAFLSQAAPQWTVCDHYFAGIMAPTYPNRFYQHAAQTDRLDQSLTISKLPTIWDRLTAAGVTGRYYYSDVPFLALWGLKYLPISRPYTEFLAACATGTLPEVSFVDPRFLDEANGTSNDDHPHADIRNGEAFLNQVYQAVTLGPAWAKTVLVITFDEWGGFFDHVPPPVKAIPASDAALGSDGRLGFRVPALVISPFAQREYVADRQFDHTSVLKMIEWRWGLSPLSVRDAGANNLVAVLNLKTPMLEAPQYAVPPGPFGTPCKATATAQAAGEGGDEDTEWVAVREVAERYGFPIY